MPAIKSPATGIVEISTDSGLPFGVQISNGSIAIYVKPRKGDIDESRALSDMDALVHLLEREGVEYSTQERRVSHGNFVDTIRIPPNK